MEMQVGENNLYRLKNCCEVCNNHDDEDVFLNYDVCNLHGQIVRHGLEAAEELQKQVRLLLILLLKLKLRESFSYYTSVLVSITKVIGILFKIKGGLKSRPLNYDSKM